MGHIIDVRNVLAKVVSACKIPYMTVHRINGDCNGGVNGEEGEVGASIRLAPAISDEEAAITKERRTVILTPRKKS